MTVAAAKKNIQVQVGRTFQRSWRIAKDDSASPTYYSWSDAAVKIYTALGTEASAAVSASASGDTDGNITVTITAANSADITDPSTANRQVVPQWAYWELNGIETTTGRVIGIFYGRVDLLRELGADT